MGSFEFAIGHLFWWYVVLNAIKQNLNVKKLLPLELGDIIQDIIDDFIKNWN